MRWYCHEIEMTGCFHEALQVYKGKNRSFGWWLPGNMIGLIYNMHNSDVLYTN